MKKKQFHLLVKKNRKHLHLFAFFIFLLAVLPMALILVDRSQEIRKKAAETSLPSPKKGIGGGATLTSLNLIKANWFYNWGYLPGYTAGSGLNNYDEAVWKKFVPLITIKTCGNTANIMNLICTNTAYCNGGYYLLGNEPDIVGQDYVDGYSQDQMAEYSARQIGTAIKAIKARDPAAKPIILGISSPFATGFVEKFISKWKTVWAGDAQIASLPAVIKGWHFHIYDNYEVCPNDDRWISDFVTLVNAKLQSYFGTTVANQEIWVTEIGSLDNFGSLPAQGSAGRSDFLNRMSCLANTYERSNLVTRYAWFHHGCNPAINSFCPDSIKFFKGNLFIPEGTTGFTLTDLGVRYASLGISGGITSSPKSIAPTATPIPISSMSLSSSLSCKWCYGDSDHCRTNCGHDCISTPESNRLANCSWKAYNCCTSLVTPSATSSPKSIAPTATPTLTPIPQMSCRGCWGGPGSCDPHCGHPCISTPESNRLANCSWKAYNCCK